MSLPCLLDLIHNYPIVRQNTDFQISFKKEIILRSQFKYNEDWIKRLAEPRFCYKSMHNHLNATQKWRNQELGVDSSEEHSYMKKLVIDNNSHYLYDFIQNCLNPMSILPKSDQIDIRRGQKGPLNIEQQADIINKKIVEKQMQITLLNQALMRLGVNLSVPQ